MQISPQELNKITQGCLEQGQLQAYWVEGKEPLLVEQSRNQLIAYAQKTIDARKIEHVQTNFDWEKLLAETNTMGLFNEGTIYDLRLEKMNKKDLPFIAQFIQNLDDQQFLIISSDKLEKKFTQLKDFKALNQTMGVITHWPLELRAYPQWIESYSKSLGLNIETNARKWLASQYEGNLFALKQCLDRLWIFFQAEAQSEALTIETLETHTRFEAKFTLFETLDLSISGQEVKALQALQQLKTQGQEPILLLWAIDQAIDSIQTAQRMRSQQQKINWPAFRVFGPRVSLMESAIKRLDPQTLALVKNWCGLIDSTIKGLHKFDVWIGFEMILAVIANPSSKIRTISETTLHILESSEH